MRDPDPGPPAAGQAAEAEAGILPVRAGQQPRPTVLLACPIMRELVGPRLSGTGVPEIYMDYGLHLRPKRMAPALQERLDALPGPSTVLLGYGLCGAGLSGLRAGPHTLIIPRTHDCIAILLGSHRAYMRAQAERPGTYYLTRGWLESNNHPLGQYRDCLDRYGEDAAGHVVDAMYSHYTDLVYLASTREELEECRPRVREIAEFCAARWDMTYTGVVGSAAMIEGLLAAPLNPRGLGEDFLVIPPGGRVESRMFLRD